MTDPVPVSDPEEEALTRVWMSTTLCLTFVTLTTIAFACAAWGVPVFERLRGDAGAPSGIAALGVAVSRAVRGHPVAGAIAYATLLAAAVGLQVASPSRVANIRIFVAGAACAFLATAACLAVGFAGL